MSSTSSTTASAPATTTAPAPAPPRPRPVESIVISSSSPPSPPAGNGATASVGVHVVPISSSPPSSSPRLPSPYNLVARAGLKAGPGRDGGARQRGRRTGGAHARVPVSEGGFGRARGLVADAGREGFERNETAEGDSEKRSGSGMLWKRRPGVRPEGEIVGSSNRTGLEQLGDASVDETGVRVGLSRREEIPESPRSDIGEELGGDEEVETVGASLGRCDNMLQEGRGSKAACVTSTNGRGSAAVECRPCSPHPRSGGCLPILSPQSLTETLPKADGGSMEPVTKEHFPVEEKPNTAVEKLASTKPAKPLRKKIKKSESIVLNSDEEPSTQDVALRMESQLKQKKTKAAEARNRKSRKATKSEDPKGKNLEASSLHGLRDNMPKKRGVTATTTAGTSEYFAKVDTSTVRTDAARKSTLQEEEQDCNEADLSTVETMPHAPTRRKSWTPVKDTAVVALSPESRENPNVELSSSRRLADLLGSFEYVASGAQDPIQPSRGDTGEPLVKRPRLETTDPLVNSMNAPTSLPIPPHKLQRTKLPKKKPQTITALATAAYQIQQEQPAPPAPLNGFSKPTVENPNLAQLEAEAAQSKPKKPRQPRKSRAKNNDALEKSNVKQTSKRKKSQAKVDEAPPMPELYSPVRANLQSSRQQFLFGTSSQLAVDEPPSFVQDIQAAVLASEEFRIGEHPTGTQRSSTQHRPSSAQNDKSYDRVPSAPHGTSLSVGQGDRGLWGVAARGRDGGLFRHKNLVGSINKDTVSNRPQRSVAMEGDEATEKELLTESAHAAKKDLPAAASKSSPDDDTVVVVGGNESHCEASTEPLVEAVALPRSADRHADTIDNHTAFERLESNSQTLLVDNDDGWIFLQSDSPKPAARMRTASHISLQSREVSLSPSRFLKSPPSKSPLRTRSPLRSLDTNTSMMAHTEVEKYGLSQSRALSTTTSRDARKKGSTKWRAGQPRTSDGAASTPKRRGRPPKTIASVVETAAKSSETKAVDQAKVQPPVTTEDWLNIDEISDSDSPITPSPPRRPPGSSPSAVPSLDLEGAPSAISALPQIKTPSVAPPSFRETDSRWPAILAKIFPQITAKVKSSPRDLPGNLSWWDKILLYDPIELETLTAWLNEQGLTVELRRLKPKPVKRGRKKKQDAEAARDGEGHSQDMKEFETFLDELKPWMVQKWCEEKSICCYWKTTVRHGIRGTTY